MYMSLLYSYLPGKKLKNVLFVPTLLISIEMLLWMLDEILHLSYTDIRLLCKDEAFESFIST